MTDKLSLKNVQKRGLPSFLLLFFIFFFFHRSDYSSDCGDVFNILPYSIRLLSQPVLEFNVCQEIAEG